MSFFLDHYYEIAAVILFGIGFITVLLHPMLIKKIIGLNIMDTSIFLFLTAKGYIAGRIVPIISDQSLPVETYINPLPTGLVLTGIVVAVSVTAFSLALCLRLYHEYGTLDVNQIEKLARERRE